MPAPLINDSRCMLVQIISIVTNFLPANCDTHIYFSCHIDQLESNKFVRWLMEIQKLYSLILHFAKYTMYTFWRMLLIIYGAKFLHFLYILKTESATYFLRIKAHPSWLQLHYLNHYNLHKWILMQLWDEPCNCIYIIASIA